MQPQEKHDVGQIETKVKDLTKNLAKLAHERDFEELIKVIKQPGWTTPAEFKLVTGVVDSMIAQTKALTDLKQVLIEGSRSVNAK